MRESGGVSERERVDVGGKEREEEERRLEENKDFSACELYNYGFLYNYYYAVYKQGRQ